MYRNFSQTLHFKSPSILAAPKGEAMQVVRSTISYFDKREGDMSVVVQILAL